jgi:hypothetical protein
MSIWKTIQTFSNQIEAEIAAGLLNEHGIETNIQADNIGGTQPALSLTAGVKLQVPADQAEEAIEILNSTRIQQNDS